MQKTANHIPYRIYAYNVCVDEGVRNTQEEARVTLTVPIDSVVNISSLEVSPGYYPDRVTFDWTYEEESNYRYIDGYKIYGRALGATDVPALVNNASDETFDWFTNQVQAGVLYEYFLIAAGICGDEELYSYNIQDSILDLQSRIPPGGALIDSLPSLGLAYGVGFRSPSGLIHGNITYTGGVAVPDVKVTVNRTDGATGRSLYFDGVDDYIEIDSTNYLNALSDSFSISTWVRPERIVSSFQSIVTRTQTFSLGTADDDIVLYIYDGSFGWIRVDAYDVLTASQYIHVTLTYKDNNIKFYVDGELVTDQAISINATGIRDRVFIGGVPWGGQGYYFEGYIDEMRLFSTELDSIRIKKDYSRFIAPNTTDLVAYWRMDEGYGPYLFDVARSGGIFHQNDGRLHGPQWSNVVPDTRQLGMAGYTNEAGNYTVNGIFYTGNGNSFEVTPTITLGGAVHEFSPVEKLEFIGEGNSILNNIDFQDISSFRVTGQVIFDYNGVQSGSPGVSFFINGSIPVVDSNGALLVSDDNGNFDIQVPIGRHTIIARKPYHEFQNNGKWPTLSDFYDFQEDVNGIIFTDETRRTLIGRIVGGLTEGDKVVGFGLSSNNIGQARFILQSQDGTINQPITTNLLSGEYAAALPPKRYTIYQGAVPTNPGITVTNNPNAELYFTNLEDIDLSSLIQIQYNENTIYDPLNPSQVDRVDSVAYHMERSFIYRAIPQITVADGSTARLGQPLRGEEYFVYQNLQGLRDTVDLFYGQPGGAPFPVFKKLNPYQLQISLVEQYINRDIPATPTTSQSPVTDGSLTITNYVGKGFYTDELGMIQYYTAGDPGTVADIIELESVSGDTIYSFVSADPDIAINNVDLANSFTRTLQVTARAGGNVVYWPGPGQTELFRAYIFGSTPIGTSFVTRAPEMVDFILRDPPGSGSTAELSRGSTITQAHSLSVGGSSETDLEISIGVSTSTFIGAGLGVFAGVINDASAQAVVGLNFSLGFGYDGQWVESYTLEESFGTSEDLVGAEGDLYVGKSQNLRFGISQSLALVPEPDCTKPEIACPFDGQSAEFILMSRSNNPYQIGSKIGLFLSPDGSPTFFIYTQKHIEEELVPRIRSLRNSLFLNNAKYISNIPGDQELYGSNNDDPRWPNPTSNYPETDPDDDFSGPSYTFAFTDDTDIDSVRWYNQQIRLWEESIANNEREKLEAFNRGNGDNKSFSALASYTSTSTTTRSQEHSFGFETALGVSAGFETDISIFGVGSSLSLNQSFTVNTGYSYSRGVEEETSYSYTLSDGDAGDFFSVDVYEGENGNGPIFLLKDGGESSCPHEEAFVTKYHNPGTTVGSGTLQRDVPRLEISVPTVYNVPSNESAAYTLNLYNDSHASDMRDYTLALVQESNPFGAIVSIDGDAVTGGTEYSIPPNASIQKTMLIGKGPYEYAYEDIAIEMQAACDSDVNDEASFSAYFTPSCTDIDILVPQSNWVVNSFFNDTLDISIGGYNINYVGLEDIELRYKPSTASGWILLETFFKDTTGMNDPSARVIPRDRPTCLFEWDMTQLPDATYDILAVSNCIAPDIGTTISTESEVFNGLVDRVRPHAFGRPQPADGILSPQDEIIIQFNEAIHAGILSTQSFDLRGVLNGGDIRHPASITFDGDENHYMRIGEGAIDLRKKSFTIDLYLRRSTTGTSVFFSQGALTNQSLQIGFTLSDRVYFKLASKTVTGSTPITDTFWHHIAVTYDVESSTSSITIDAIPDAVSNQFSTIYQGTGETWVGKSTVDTPRTFRGSIHELRIWNKVLTEGQVAIAAVKRQTRSSLGLIANWRMEEGSGDIAKDHIRSKHAEVFADWLIEPSGQAIYLDGNNQYAEASSPGFGRRYDFSIEFWFRSDEAREICFLSNGRGDNLDSNIDSWALGALTNGNVFVRHNDTTLESSGKNYHDGTWHHFALVVSRVGNTILYVDGDQLASLRSESFKSFAGSKLWIGARGWYDGSLERRDLYLKGSIDEIRIWNSARSETQLKIGRYSKLRGDEIGLIRYYAFEKFIPDAGIFIVIPTAASIVNEIESNDLTFNGPQYSSQSPPVQQARPVSSLPFNFSANGDRIIISPNISNELIENIILDITVKDVFDLNGNSLASPVTWSAYVDRNQMVWTEETRRFDLTLGESIEFNVDIRNNSGAVQRFEIHNMPEWLQVEPTSGSLSPLSGREISFTINAGINIGQYVQDIYLNSDFGFDERLILDIKVQQSPPEDWTVDPNDFQFSMSIVGQIRMDGILSRDEEDIITAFVGNEPRGAAHLRYIPELDSYITFLSIYSNQSSGEALKFQVWNASEGQIHSQVTPEFPFESNALQGSINTPVIFEVPDFIRKEMPLHTGWQWISFNTQSTEMNSVNDFMSSVEAQEGDIIKDIEYFDQYDLEEGWIGSLSSNGGLQNGHNYKIKVQEGSTLSYEGSPIDAEQVPIVLQTGWNWIGFTPQNNLSIQSAFSRLNPEVGDQIKGQLQFSVYAGGAVGWVGTLEYLQPNEGYMFYSTRDITFTFPNITTAYGRIVTPRQQRLNELRASINAAAYRDNMTMIVRLSGLEVNENHTLIAYINGEIRGVSDIQSNDEDQSFAFITVLGEDAGKDIDFQLRDLSTKEQIALRVDQQVVFQQDALMGTLSDPILMQPFDIHRSPDSIRIMPNPITDAMNIALDNPKERLERVEVYSEQGARLAVIEKEHIKTMIRNYRLSTSQWIGQTKGVLLVKIFTNQGIYTRRVIRK